MNNNLLSYKGFYGSVNFSASDDVFYGKVEGVHDLVSFEGDTVKDLKRRFQEAAGYSSEGGAHRYTKKYITESVGAASY